MTLRRTALGAVAALLVGLAVAVAVRGESPDESSSSEPSESRAEEPPSCDDLRGDVASDAVESWLREEGGVAEQIVDDPATFRAQVLVRETRVRKNATDCLIRRGFRVDEEYVYPASAIKTVAAVEALQFAGRWRADDRTPELGLDSVLWYRRPDDFDVRDDSEFAWKRGGALESIVRDTLVVSSNEAFNKLYDLVGHERLNRGMWDAGLESVRLQHRMFSKRTVEEQKWAPKVAVEVPGENSDGPRRETIRPQRTSSLDLPEIPADRLEVGETHTSFLTGEFHEKPMDFSTKNYMSLQDLQRLMVELYRPNLLEDVEFPDLGEYRDFLTSTLGEHPEAETEDEKRALVRRFSPMLPGVADVVDRDRFSYHNKAGRAYGFHLDNARIVDWKTGREVFVAAAVYVNEDGEVNDDDYEYEKRSYPFLRAVGRAAARHALAD